MSQDGPKYDLEDRTYGFAKAVRGFVKRLPRTLCNIEDVKQLVRSSGSVGSNYIEANDSLGRKDFLMHIRISRKEAKESRYWLRLVDTRDNEAVERERLRLVDEAEQLMKIFGAILRKNEE
ncbi:MAG: four helix bundle protein [Pirellulaceae bacterium]|nr:four helix bundle protein [Pirellulaceae bacterium]